MHEMFRRNVGAKLAALLFAILFWLFVANQNSSDLLTGEQTLTIPLVSRGLPQNMVVMTRLPLVRVRLTGINPSVNIKDLYAEIDLSGGTPGEKIYEIKVNTPPGTKVVDLQPAEVKLQLDTVQEKTVPVQANVTGNPADGYQMGSAIIKPSSVNVRGPSSVLGMLEKVTVDIPVNGANDTIRMSPPVSFRDKSGKPIFGPDPSVDILSASPSSVDVIVPIISKGLSSKMIPLKVTSKGTPASGMVLRSLLPSPSSVEILGTPEALKGFDSLTLGPFDISNLAADKVFQVSPDKVTLPTGVSFPSGTTLTVVAQIGPGPIQKTIAGVPVQIRNIGTGLDVDQPPSTIDVTVEGLPDVIKNLTSDQLQLWVDASGLGAGPVIDAKVYWQLPSGVTMISTPQVSFGLKAR